MWIFSHRSFDRLEKKIFGLDQEKTDLHHEEVIVGKKTLLCVIGMILIVVSCELVNKRKRTQGIDAQESQVEPHAHQKGRQSTATEGQSRQNNGDIALVGAQDPKAEPKKSTEETKLSNSVQVTQYDGQALDKQVKEEAAIFGKDEKHYRMLLRTEADGTKIYRMIGMHVIVNPNGEEAYLPDEL